MKRRPVCLVCLILMFCIWLMDLAGFARISGNPLPESVQLYIEKHPEAVICGEVQQYQATEYSLSAYLKHVCLIVGSEQIPIKNLRVFLKSNKEFPIGTIVKISGKLEEIPEPRNPGEFDSRQFYACQKIYYFMKNGVVLAWSSKYSRYGQFMQNLKSKIMQTLDIAAKEDAGIFEAMLLGEKDNLEDEVKIRYQMAGIIHILAISGLHISVLGIGFFDLLKRAGFGNVSAGMVVHSVLLQYGILTGESVSAMRAVGMFLVAAYFPLMSFYKMQAAKEIFVLTRDNIVTGLDASRTNGLFLAFHRSTFLDMVFPSSFWRVVPALGGFALIFTGIFFAGFCTENKVTAVLGSSAMLLCGGYLYLHDVVKSLNPFYANPPIGRQLILGIIALVAAIWWQDSIVQKLGKRTDL